ncbi:MAG: SDR family oxidoreductase, partial [bacterium]|nr:SDR family oxidoreductase [bacterium]
GLGRHLAVGFGEAGSCVALHYHRGIESVRQAAVAVKKGGGEALTMQADLADPSRIGPMVDQVLDRWGRIDVLVNNAAVCRDAPLATMVEADWDRVMATNFSGPFHVMKAAAPAMIAQGGGQIVNVLSISATRGSAGQANYAAAKAGLLGLTLSAAREWGSHNIRVNGVSPGFMETDMTEGLPEGIRNRALRESCLGRLCDPGDVVIFVKALVATRGITGQVFHLDSRLV